MKSTIRLPNVSFGLLIFLSGNKNIFEKHFCFKNKNIRTEIQSTFFFFFVVKMVFFFYILRPDVVIDN